VLTDAAETLVVAMPADGGWSRIDFFGGGSHGAELWGSESGRRVIVKHHRDAPLVVFETIVRRIDAMRRAGVPAPATTVAAHGDDVLLIHDYLPGRSDPELTRPLVDDLLAIVEREAGLADDSAQLWAGLVQTSLTDGLDGYCEHGSLATFSDASRSLLARARHVGQDPSVSQLRAPDLVHYDLHTNNVLSEDSRHVSGIIDWDAVRSGDRALDLAILAFTSTWKTADNGLLEQIWHAFLSSSSHDARVVYMHHVVLRQVDWVIRHGIAPGALRTIELASWALTLTDRGAFSPPPAC
jgi:aminoglycoside phosphotransferase (APT) family kinase protein